jgi:GNAT superfamily N-acetyltransferase
LAAILVQQLPCIHFGLEKADGKPQLHLFAKWRRIGDKMREAYSLVRRLPTAAEYHRLRAAVGWESMDPESTEIGLRNSLFSICVLFGKEAIGCGRVIGDGAIFFYIQDIMVLPEHQKKGVGRMIMDAIMDFLGAHARQYTFVGLMAAKGASKFYEKFGFAARPPDRPGMFKEY